MKYLELLERTLMEINMRPSALRQAVQGIDARAGMEFEMIVPNIGSLDDDDFESEPDYDQDESISDFEDIRNFFHDGDHNSRRDVDRLMAQLDEEFLDSDWLDEKKREYWENESTQAIRDLVERDYEDELMSQAEEEVKADTPEFGVNAEELDTAIQERYQELFEEKVDSILADMGSEYDEAFDEWVNDEWYRIIDNEDLRRDWLDHQGYHAMSDISNNFDINWPHWTEPGSEYGSGGENAQQIADDFSEYMNKKVNFSMNYHGGRREPGAYVVEPDGSLEGDNPGDQGLEFVSPPMPINELLADLIAVKEWAGNNGCYTNDSTGLHINVSVPGFSMEKLDYVKLALLLGDEYVLEAFGRTGNTYAKSALSIIKQHIKQRPEDAAALLGKMKEHLNTAAAKVIHSGVTNKYTSINTKTGYIEFRSPGGDWLDENFDKIENTLLRFVVALDAALDETKYKEEYAKKLYKVLAPSSDEPGILELFANFSAGELPKDALIRQVRSAQLQRDIAKGKTPAGKKYWWNVQWDANRRMEVVAANKQEAREVAAKEWAVSPDRLAIAKVTALRPYDENAAKPKFVYKVSIGNDVGARSLEVEATSPEEARMTAARLAGHRNVTSPDQIDWWPVRQLRPAEPEQPAAQQPQATSQSSARQPAGRNNFEIYDTRTGARVEAFHAESNASALSYLEAYQAQGPHNLSPDEAWARYKVRPIDDTPAFVDTTTERNRGDLTPRGPGPWEIYRLSDGQAARDLEHTNRSAAEAEARSALGLRGEDPELYGVRTRQQAQAQAPAQSAEQWEIVNNSTGEVVERVRGTRQQANDHALNTYGHRFIYAIRPMGTQQ